MNANALALKKVKFYGGILVSENGTYSLSHEQGTPDYFGPPGSETDHAWGQLVKGSTGLSILCKIFEFLH